jgi:hypothetical protein
MMPCPQSIKAPRRHRRLLHQITLEFNKSLILYFSVPLGETSV